MIAPHSAREGKLTFRELSCNIISRRHRSTKMRKKVRLMGKKYLKSVIVPVLLILPNAANLSQKPNQWINTRGE